jgi:excisionase family DNA binding protein
LELWGHIRFEFGPAGPVKRARATAVRALCRNMQNLLTVKEVAALLRVSAQTLYKMLDNGEIPAVKVGSQWRFDRDRIRDWLQQRSSEGSAGSDSVTGR